MSGIPGLFLLETDGQQPAQLRQEQQQLQHQQQQIPQATEHNQTDNVMTDAPEQHQQTSHKDSDMMDFEASAQPTETVQVKQEVHTGDVSMGGAQEESKPTQVKEEPKDNNNISQEIGHEYTGTSIKQEETPQETKISGVEAPGAKQDEEMGETGEAKTGEAEAEAEFEFTSDEESSSSDSSDDSDSDVDPADARDLAKRLMEELDDEDAGDGSAPKTLHELDESELKVEIPDIKMTMETKMEKLGTVQTTVENQVLIKAVTDGAYRVLDEGSVLATANRVVIGVVADVIGRVEAPLYTVRFNSIDEIQNFNLVFGKEIYYLPDHSTYVFTNPLMSQKGTDASNLYDEEVPESEQEASDDEAEAARKAAKKKGGKRGKKQTGEAPKRQETRQNNKGVQLADDEPYIPLYRPSNLPDKPPPAHPSYPPQQQNQDSRQFSGNNQRGNNGWQQGRNDRGGNRNQRAPYSPPSRQQSSSYNDEPYNTNRRPSYPQQQPQQAYTQPQVSYQQPQQYPAYPQFTNAGYPSLPVPISPAQYTPPVFTPTQLPPGSHINPAFLQQMQQQSPAAQTPSYPFPQQPQQQQQPQPYSFNPYGQPAQSPPQTPFTFGAAPQQAWGAQPAVTPSAVPAPGIQGQQTQPQGGNDEAFKKIQENLALLSSLGGVQ